MHYLTKAYVEKLSSFQETSFEQYAQAGVSSFSLASSLHFLNSALKEDSMAYRGVYLCCGLTALVYAGYKAFKAHHTTPHSLALEDKQRLISLENALGDSIEEVMYPALAKAQSIKGPAKRLRLKWNLYKQAKPYSSLSSKDLRSLLFFNSEQYEPKKKKFF